MRFLFIILFIICSSAAFAQQDTTRQFKENLTKADSSSSRVNTKIDSIQSKVNNILNPDLSLNSITRKAKINKRKEKKDSIQFYQQLDVQKKQVQFKIDSLSNSGLSADKYVHQLDSLEKVTYQKKERQSVVIAKKQQLSSAKQKLTQQPGNIELYPTGKYKSKLDTVARLQRVTDNVIEVESKVSSAEQKINAPVNKVEGTVNEKLSLMNTQGGAAANVPSGTNIPDATLNTDLNLPQSGLKINNPVSKVDNPLNDQLGGVGEAKGKITEVKAIPQEQIGKVKSIDEVKSVQGKVSEANVITDKAQAYSGDVKNIASGNLNEVKEAPKALESKAAEIGGLDAVQKEAGALTQYKDLAANGNDPEAMKKLAMQQAQASFKAPVNHFAGQEKALTAAMDKMSKLKTKYSELSSIKDLPKRKPNEMKGKPFIERILPGITLQVQKQNDVLIDYNPYLGYRISGKLTAGAGWNERFNVGRHFHFSLNGRIYGPRAYVDFKVWKGFSVRTDIEKMNTYVPSIVSLSDPSHRTWVWSAFIGLKKEYKFWGSVKGNAQFLYNLYDDHDNSPYGDRFAVRMGFEFPMKEKPKPNRARL